MQTKYRNYEKTDYPQVETLVNEAWEFDKNFRPQALANLTKLIYTKGSEINSNYKRVVEIDGKVAGFIFGLNEKSTISTGNLLFGLFILWRLLRIKPENPSSRSQLLNAFKTHEANRTRLVNKGRSEIVLFVVGKSFMKQGYGKKLWSEFLSHCQESSVKSIIVETNKLETSRFYEQQGFKLMGDFDSPVHEYAAKGGQACIYKYESK